MDRQMMYYWGLVPAGRIGGELWNNTIRLPILHNNDLRIEPRRMPHDTHLTAWEMHILQDKMGQLRWDPVKEEKTANLHNALDVVCDRWLQSCKAEYCFWHGAQMKANPTITLCPDWWLTLECLKQGGFIDLQHNLRPKVHNITGWESDWGKLTEQVALLPPYEAKSNVTIIYEGPHHKRFWGWVALIADAIVELLNLSKTYNQEWIDKGGFNMPHKHHPPPPWRPQRVGNENKTCRWKPRKKDEIHQSATAYDMFMNQFRATHPGPLNISKDMPLIREKVTKILKDDDLTDKEYIAEGYQRESEEQVQKMIHQMLIAGHNITHNATITSFPDMKRDVQVPMLGTARPGWESGPAAYAGLSTGLLLLIGVGIALLWRCRVNRRRRSKVIGVEIEAVQMDDLVVETDDELEEQVFFLRREYTSG